MNENGRTYLNRPSNYDALPRTKIAGGKAIAGYERILAKIAKRISRRPFVLTVDCYPGVDDAEVLGALLKLKPDVVIDMKRIFKDRQSIGAQLKYQLTDDRVFGRMYAGEVSDFLDENRWEAAREQAALSGGFVLVYGFGASLVARGDLLIYADLARWEIQQRYRRGVASDLADDADVDLLAKYKRGFFVEWRIADKHKSELFAEIDYLLDTNRAGQPKMVSGRAFLNGLRQLTARPFRTVPYFDPGVWGGQWMKEVCGLDPREKNYAWCFDGVPEENSLLLDYGGVLVEVPAMDLVLYQPKALLGEQVFARFGAEFPIRFDFLDTMEGGNLSLQVHPLTDYIKKNFGMAYTQDESYYILDAKQDAVVYLGVKEGVNRKAMIAALREAHAGEKSFDAEAYVNKFPAHKHDHFLIPAGTCHCAGKNVMVLEISATPYIFTFKLWDWGRLGLDGKPRPIHISHGEKVIDWSRDTKWVDDHLINAMRVVRAEEEWVEEHTGLDELSFIETRRYWFDAPIALDTRDTVHMLNLVQGTQVVVESPNEAFEPFIAHYVETFIVPARVGPYRVRPMPGERACLLKAYVRSGDRV